MMSIPPIPERWRTSPGTFRRLCQRLVETVPHVSLAKTRVRLRACRPYLEDPGGGMGRHSHAYTEAVIFLEGTARLLPDGALLPPGTVLVHHPHELHAWEPTSRMLRVVVNLDVMSPQALISPLPPEASVILITDLLRALAEIDGQQPGWDERVRCLATLVCSTLLAAGVPLRQHAPSAEALRDNLATEVDAFLRENLARPIRLADLARHVGLCERTLTQQYRHVTGDTIFSRLRRIRLEAAQALLQSSAYSLAEIGQRVGLPDPAYLCRCYVRQFGQPPGHHRRSFRRGE